MACYFLAVTAYKKWQAARGGGVGKCLGALGTSLFALPFFAGEIFGAGHVKRRRVHPRGRRPWPVMGFLNALFYHLLKAPTLSGRKIMDQIEGFKLYLSVAEKDRLNLLNPPEKTPALFEKYLPYALALDVENAWSEQFAEVLARAGTESQPYCPRLVFRQFLGQLPHLPVLRQPGRLLCRRHLVLLDPPGFILGKRRRRVLRRRRGRRRRQRLVGGGYRGEKMIWGRGLRAKALTPSPIPPPPIP